ncbi:trichohyalin-like [Toxorhynchites rutilus septentrionalis]|uniref:trichohyalin-like n=1 Tax=Toxorhynchites rutilus septentrionalis TaxID=329112 RepID=UPI00247978A9|nr:trichohyalin-like [Toxorhynchites rutilus septentrionalis]
MRRFGKTPKENSNLFSIIKRILDSLADQSENSSVCLKNSETKLRQQKLKNLRYKMDSEQRSIVRQTRAMTKAAAMKAMSNPSNNKSTHEKDNNDDVDRGDEHDCAVCDRPNNAELYMVHAKIVTDVSSTGQSNRSSARKAQIEREFELLEEEKRLMDEKENEQLAQEQALLKKANLDKIERTKLYIAKKYGLRNQQEEHGGALADQSENSSVCLKNSEIKLRQQKLKNLRYKMDSEQRSIVRQTRAMTKAAAMKAMSNPSNNKSTHEKDNNDDVDRGDEHDCAVCDRPNNAELYMVHAKIVTDVSSTGQSNRSSARKAQIEREFELLEEEKRLMDEKENEQLAQEQALLKKANLDKIERTKLYIAKKYGLRNQQEEHGGGASVHSLRSNRTSNQRVGDWIQTQRETADKTGLDMKQADSVGAYEYWRQQRTKRELALVEQLRELENQRAKPLLDQQRKKEELKCMRQMHVSFEQKRQQELAKQEDELRHLLTLEQDFREQLRLQGEPKTSGHLIPFGEISSVDQRINKVGGETGERRVPTRSEEGIIDSHKEWYISEIEMLRKSRRENSKLEAVSSFLLHPLQTQFGRPEQIVKIMVTEVRETPAPASAVSTLSKWSST